MKFRTVSCPRTEEGGFQNLYCKKCGYRSTAFLIIQYPSGYNVKYDLICASCLQEGIDMVHKTIIEECKGKALSLDFCGIYIKRL